MEHAQLESEPADAAGIVTILGLHWLVFV